MEARVGNETRSDCLIPSPGLLRMISTLNQATITFVTEALNYNVRMSSTPNGWATTFQ